MKKPLYCLLLLCLLLMGCPAEEEANTAEPTPKPTPVSHWKAPAEMPNAKNNPKAEQIKYGEALINRTPAYLSPSAPDASLRVAGNHLACKNCHLQGGKAVHAMGFIGIDREYPKMYAPLNREVSLEERVEACFKGSLNGKNLPAKERDAMVAYMRWLGSEVPESAPVPLPEAGLPALELEKNNTQGNPEMGADLYAYHCNACHGKDGLGLVADAKDLSKGYTFPPVWGPDSYGKNSSMANVQTAARYLHKNMPLGHTILSESQAVAIAAYLQQQERP